MDLDRIEHHAYTTIIDANGGEEQILVTLSAGQNGKYAVMITQASCDGGMKCWRFDSVVNGPTHYELPGWLQARMVDIGFKFEDAINIVTAIRSKELV